MSARDIIESPDFTGPGVSGVGVGPRFSGFRERKKGDKDKEGNYVERGYPLN